MSVSFSGAIMKTVRPIKRSHRSLDLSHLELRRLLTAWAPLDDGAWNIRGTERADQLTIEVDPDRTSMAVLRQGTKVIQKARLRDIDSIRIDALGGNDRVQVNLPVRSAGVRVSVDGGWGHDTLIGGAANDELLGGLGSDVLEGRGGNDSLNGGHGGDVIIGEAGDDLLQGKLGDDTLDGGLGKDDINGGRDNDALEGAGGRDSLMGSAGIDHLDGGSGRDVLAGGSGEDVIVRQTGRDTVSDSTASLVNTTDVARLGQTAGGAFVGKLIDRAVQQYQWYFDRPMNYPHGQINLDYASTNSIRGNALSGDSTNVQVAGVDEADSIETDGRYLYSIDDDELRILDLADAKSMSVRSTTALNGSSFGMYLLPGSRLVILSRQIDTSNADGSLIGFWGNRSMVTVTSYDVSNPAAPVELGHTDLDGYYSDSRVIGNSVYVITGQTLEVSPQTRLVGSSYVSETEAHFRARLASDLSWIPSFKASRNGVEVADGTLMTEDNTYLSDKPDAGFNFANVAVIDGRNAGNGPIDSATMDGTWVNQVYASPTAIYLAGTNWTDGASVNTAITKLSITESTVDIQASGEIAGSLDSQFALDESGGYLRAATTSGFGVASTNTITILETRGDTLAVVGRVADIAPGERIFSTRFVADKAYVVTFRQVDPFFVIDLSDPTQPHVAGALKIPGVSNYLQPINDQYVLGIGQAGDDSGILHGLQVSLFDVSNQNQPRRVSTLELDSDRLWASSVALFDHHAVQYFPDEGILSLPVNGSTKTSQKLIHVNLLDPALALESSLEVGASGDTRSLKIGDSIFATDGHVIRAYSLDEHAAGEPFNFNPQANPIVNLCGWGWWFRGSAIE